MHCIKPCQQQHAHTSSVSPAGTCPPSPASTSLQQYQGPRMRLQLTAAEPAAGASLPFSIFTGWMLKRAFPRNCAAGRMLWHRAGTWSVTPHLCQELVGIPMVGHRRCWEKMKESNTAAGPDSGGGCCHACHTVNS